MSPEDEQELWRRLHKIDRQVGLIAALAVMASAWGLGLLLYWTLPDEWGVSKGVGGWIAFAVASAFGAYFGHKFDRL